MIIQVGDTVEIEYLTGMYFHGVVKEIKDNKFYILPENLYSDLGIIEVTIDDIIERIE